MAGIGLGKWNEDHRGFFYTLLVKQYPIKRALEMVIEEFPDAHPYVYENILHHVKTDRAKDAIRMARDVLANSLRNSSYADPARRLSFAIEQSERLADLMREDGIMPVDHKRLGEEMRKWNGEIRIEESYLAALNPETIDANPHVMDGVIEDDEVPEHVRRAASSLRAV